MTKSDVELHKEGIVPHIQVHDELDISAMVMQIKLKRLWNLPLIRSPN